MGKKDDDKASQAPSAPSLVYSLSDKTFIDCGWTVLPYNEIQQKVITYNSRPLRSSVDWLSNHKFSGDILYPSGELLAGLQDNIYTIFYKSGRIAIKIQSYNIENSESQYQRYTLRDDDVDNTILGILDSLCQAIIFDNNENIRLKYNQYEGVLYDPSIGPPRTWRWNQQYARPKYEYIFKDSFLFPPDEKLLALVPPMEEAIQKPEKLKSAKTRPTRTIPLAPQVVKAKLPSNIVVTPLPLKPITVKINCKQMSLRILSQKQIYLLFDYVSHTIKFELGVVLTNELINRMLLDPGVAPCAYEQVSAHSPSLAQLHSEIKSVRKTMKTKYDRYNRIHR